MTTLDNGLRVLVIPTTDAGIVAVQTWVDVGSGDETEPGTSGYAHFFEHLMFHGTPSLSRLEREQRLVELGVEENAWTSQDETCYHLLAPAEYLDEILKMEVDRFANLALTAEGVRREAGAVYGEFRKSRATPEEHLYETLWSTAFSVHPYAHSTIGLESDIAAMPGGLERALRFRALHYRPDNALVVVAGDVSSQAALESVGTHFGAWQPAKLKAGTAVKSEPMQGSPRRADLEWSGPDVEPKMLIGWRVPAFRPGDSTVAALDVVVELLTARDAALYRHLVDDESLAWRLGGSEARNADPGLLQLSIDLRKDAPVDAVVASVTRALGEIRDLDDATVQAAADRIRRRMIIAVAAPADRAFAIGGMALRSGSGTALWDHVGAIQEVKASDVRAVVGTVLTDARRTIVTVGAEVSR